MTRLYQLKSGHVTIGDAVPGVDADQLAGVTAGTAAAEKVLVVDGAKHIGTLGDVRMGALTATTGTFSGAVSGTTLTATGILTAAQIRVREWELALDAGGAIAIPAYSETIYITAASAAALTLADPTPTTHDGVRLTIIAATAAAHTVSNAAGSGFNGGGSGAALATFGGTIGDCLAIEAYGGAWYVLRSTGVTFGAAE